jgi:hypothetical protein
MSIVHKTRKRRAELSPLEPWQELYLLSDGRRLDPDEYKQLTGDNKFMVYFLHALEDGQRAPHVKHRQAPWELWREYGGRYLERFISEHPGCRPLPWWQWEAPGCADPCMDGEKYFKAINGAQRRARWLAEKQRAFLEKHALLVRCEL